MSSSLLKDLREKRLAIVKQTEDELSIVQEELRKVQEESKLKKLEILKRQKQEDDALYFRSKLMESALQKQIEENSQKLGDLKNSKISLELAISNLNLKLKEMNHQLSEMNTQEQVMETDVTDAQKTL